MALQEELLVLEHQFWDLDVSDEAFAVTLSFKGAHERLVIPFDAITGFLTFVVGLAISRASL